MTRERANIFLRAVSRQTVWVFTCMALWGAGGYIVAHSQQPSHPSSVAQIDAPLPKLKFDFVSFKRCPEGKEGTTKVDMPVGSDYLAYHCESLSRIIYFAYNGAIKVYSLEVGYPKWVDTDRYEFIVKVAPGDMSEWQNLDLPARRLLIRGVLADEAKLKIRLENSPRPIYALIAGQHLKLTPYTDGDETKLPDGTVQTGRTYHWIDATIYLQGFTMADLATVLSVQTDRIVADKTNLTGRYTFAVGLFGMNVTPDSRMGSSADAPTLEDGLEKLGLLLQPTTAPVERLVIDHVERPDSN